MPESNTGSPPHREPMIQRKALLTASVRSQRPVQQVEIKEINLAAAQKTGLHRHPCHVVGYVAAGSIVYQVEGGPSRLLNAGDAFHEPENVHIVRFDNACDTAPARFIAFYLLGAGEDQLIEMLDGR